MEVNSFVSTIRKRIEVVQNNIEQKFEIDGEENIGKILCVNAEACVDSVEVLNGEAYYNGEVVFDAIVTDEQGNIMNLKEKAVLSGKIENNILNASMLPIYKVEVVNVTIQNPSSKGLKANALIELTLDCYVNEEVSPCVADSSNIQTKRSNIEVFKINGNGQTSFSLEDDFELKNKATKVLCKSANVCIKEIKSGTGYFSLEGEMNFNMCYECGEEDNKSIKYFNNTIPFKEEIEVEDLTKEDLVSVMTYIKCEDITLVDNATMEDTKSNFNLSAIIQVKYFYMNKNEREITTDAYSTTHNINLISESFEYIENIQTVCENKNVDCELSLQENQPRIGKILFVCGENASITNSYAQDEKLFVEGIITANVVYEADDDNASICSVVAENPFKVEVIEDLKPQNNIFTKSCIKSCSFRAKKGKDIELEFDLNICSEIYEICQESYVKDVELTDELKKDNYSLQIFFAPENADIWSISKQLKVSPEVITAQNPNLVFPLQKPEQIVYFVQK